MSNNPFGNTLDTQGLEAAGDRLGGGGTVDSDAYGAVITQAYAGESSGGAKSMTFHFKLDNDREFRETVYVTSGKEKGQKNYYERDGKKHPMPGFTTANDIALLATGVGLGEQTFEEKVVKIYDFDAKAELPQKVMVATSLLGKRVKLGILKEVVDKTKKNDSTGNYDPTGETREQNVINKVFHDASGQTVSELTQSRDPNAAGEFLGKWLDKNKGHVVNKATGAAGTAGVPGQNRPAPTAGTAPASAPKSLFGGG